jgi:penicillin-binding protein-related factor A (putative recombinase)
VSGRVLQLRAPDGRQRARQRSGADTEALVAALNAACRVRGEAVLRKRPTLVVRGEHVAPAGVDFHGTLRGGRAVYVEVKRCTAARFGFACLRPSQREELAETSALGALALVLVVYGPRREVYAVPWEEIDAAEREGLRSFTREQLQPYRVPPGEPYVTRAAVCW